MRYFTHGKAKGNANDNDFTWLRLAIRITYGHHNDLEYAILIMNTRITMNESNAYRSLYIYTCVNLALFTVPVRVSPAQSRRLEPLQRASLGQPQAAA